MERVFFFGISIEKERVNFVMHCSERESFLLGLRNFLFTCGLSKVFFNQSNCTFVSFLDFVSYPLDLEIVV